MEEQFEVIKIIGEGTFGIVYMGKDKTNGEIVAIKKIKERYPTWEECMNLREVKSLRKLDHQNVVKLKRVFKINDELYLVFEYIDENIFTMYQEIMKKGDQLPESKIKSMIYQTASGLSYMHKKGFFHRDLKPENLLINKKDVLKIADFGLAREIRSLPPYTDYVSTRWYRAPEILLKGTNYNSPVDIFALGCIMAELYNFRPLFNGTSEMDQLNKIVAVLGTPPQSWTRGHNLAKKLGISFPTYSAVPFKEVVPRCSPEALDLLSQMLQYDSTKRPTASQILKHPYFTNSIIKQPTVWGGVSVREQAKKKTFKGAYTGSTNTFNLKNSNVMNNFGKDDNDWELERDIDAMMTEDIPFGNKKNNKNNLSSNQNGLSTQNKGNRSFLKDGDVQEKSSLGKKWGIGDNESDDFDVFGTSNKNAKKKDDTSNRMGFEPGNTFGEFEAEFFQPSNNSKPKQKEAPPKKKIASDWDDLGLSDNPFGNKNSGWDI